MSIATNWGTTRAERSQEYPCDRYLERSGAAYFRGVTVNAPREIVFRWLCQLRVAPYSYDWIDNLGRRSPQTLTPGLEDVKVGLRFMGVELVDFARDEHLTVKMRKWTRIFGDFAVSYVVRPSGDGVCRLLVKFVVRYPRWPHGWLMRLLLPWGDLVMMRRQLLNLKALAEKMAMQTDKQEPGGGRE